tara:strand:- start:812 stop:1561 length:750 start_codon:yes stop_codon:yes gene_type:complete
MKTKFTIITVVKNDQIGIVKTIKSVLNQTFKNFEYIVIDGNSTDKTSIKIKKINSMKKFKFITRKDISYYDSLNFGIKKSKGEFIGILNSGDIYINKNTLNNINKKINKNTSIFYNNLVFKKNKKPVRYWKHKVTKITKYNLFKIPHSTLFLNKSIYKKVGLYNIKYRISSDLDFLIRLSEKFTDVKHINFNSIFMEYGGLSTSMRSLRLKLKEDFSILIKYYKLSFLIFYVLKIYFKLTDFHLRNIVK